MKKYQKWHSFYESMNRLGISQEDADSLRRIELTLHRWSERECNGEIERNEESGKVVAHHPFWLNGNMREDAPCSVPDRETGALKRLEKIMSKYPDLWSYYQGDPRGCALYVGRKSDLQKNTKIDQLYYRGVAVCL